MNSKLYDNHMHYDPKAFTSITKRPAMSIRPMSLFSSPLLLLLSSLLLVLDRPASRGPLSLLVRTRRSVELAQTGVIEVLLDACGDGLRSGVVDREHADGRLASVGVDIGLAGKAAISGNAGVDTRRVGEV